MTPKECTENLLDLAGKNAKFEFELKGVYFLIEIAEYIVLDGEHRDFEQSALNKQELYAAGIKVLENKVKELQQQLLNTERDMNSQAELFEKSLQKEQKRADANKKAGIEMADGFLNFRMMPIERRVIWEQGNIYLTYDVFWYGTILDSCMVPHTKSILGHMIPRISFE